MSNSRLEKFIYAICGMEVDDLPTPLSRIEMLWNCLITGETPDFEPLSRNEKYLMSMLTGDVDALPEPTSRSEKLLYKIATGETDLTDVPGYLSRYEELLKHLIENGGIGGTDFEYVLYTLNKPLNTLYCTAETPVKSAILKGCTLVNIHPTNYSIGVAGSTTFFANVETKRSLIKPNSKYFLRLYNTHNSVMRVYFKPCVTSTLNLLSNNNKCAIFTTKEVFSDTDFSNNKIHFYSSEPLAKEDVENTKILLCEYQDGMENWDIPYFEGMQSVKMPVLTTTNGFEIFKTGTTLDEFNYNLVNLNNGCISIPHSHVAYIETKKEYTLLPNQSYVVRVVEVSNYNNSNYAIRLKIGGRGLKTVSEPLLIEELSKNSYYDIVYTNTTGEPITGVIRVDSYFGDYKIDKIYIGEEPFKSNILTTTSKNLFDMNRPYDVITDSQATVVQDTNQITVSSAESGIYVNANFILDKDFFAGKTVTGSCLYESDEKDIGTVQIVYQDGDGEHHYQWIRTPTTFTFPNSFIGDVMLSVSANNTDTPQSNTVTVKNIQLELGSTATSYEPYSEVTLRGIGEVQDTLDGNTGELTQRIGEVVLDGNSNETWESKRNIAINGINYSQYYLINNPISKKNYSSATSLPNIISDKGVTDPFLGLWQGGSIKTISVRQDTSNDLYYFCMNFPKDEDIKEWLSQNPITICYHLETESIKTVDLSITDQDGQPTKLKTFNDITHVSIESDGLIPTVDLEVPTKIEETLSTLPTLMNDISETQQLLSESIDDQAENIKEVSTAMIEIRNDIL